MIGDEHCRLGMSTLRKQGEVLANPRTGVRSVPASTRCASRDANEDYVTGLSPQRNEPLPDLVKLQATWSGRKEVQQIDPRPAPRVIDWPGESSDPAGPIRVWT